MGAFSDDFSDDFDNGTAAAPVYFPGDWPYATVTPRSTAAAVLARSAAASVTARAASVSVPRE